MIYLVGGAPRAGKSVLAQRAARRLNVGWVATDVLATLVTQEGTGGWDATPEAIARTAEIFFPKLERFVWGISSLADDYLIEGVHFLPRQVVALSQRFPLRAVFLGCSQLTLERFEAFPGRSHGYAGLPVELKRQIVQDVPAWSELIAREAAVAGCHYVDTSDDFAARLTEAEQLLTMPRERLDVTVRSATRADIDAIVRVHVESSEEAYAPLAKTWPAVDLERRRALWTGWVEQAESGEGGRVELVGQVDGKVVGFISGGAARELEHGAELEIYAIHVLPSQRGTSIGSSLWSEACRRLRGPALRSLYVSTLAELRCCSFYERHGGQVSVRRPRPFHGAERMEVVYYWPQGAPVR